MQAVVSTKHAPPQKWEGLDKPLRMRTVIAAGIYMVWEQDYTRRGSSHVCWSGCPRPGAGSDAGAGGGGERRGSLSGTRVPIQTAGRPAGNRPGARAAALDGRVSLYEVRWPASESARVPSSSGRLHQEELCLQVRCRERGRGLLMVGGVSWLSWWCHP